MGSNAVTGSMDPAPTVRPHAIEITNVCKSFPDRHGGPPKPVLKDVSYTVPDIVGEGELRVLVGPSGCGKTTLLKLIAGLTQPTSGTLQCLGNPITDPGTDRAFMFQSHSEFPWRTVEDNVAMGLEFAGKPTKERLEAARHWLERVGLGGSGSKYPKDLSGGMRQRLALARALVMKPRVLLMDEPFGALDVRIRLEMQDLLWEVWKEIQGTVILVTHDIGEAVYLADEILVMAPDPGRIHAVVPVPLGIHRTREIEETPEFRHLVEHVRTEVRGVARSGV